MKPKRLPLQAYGTPEIEGYGEQLTFRVTAYETRRTGRRIDYVLEIKSCRHVVKQLAQAVRDMQDRDLEHIARQQARIQNEVAPLKRS
jgi:hypothetical protein